MYVAHVGWYYQYYYQNTLRVHLKNAEEYDIKKGRNMSFLQKCAIME